MFAIKSVEIEGFKAFRVKQKFTLPTAPGLYFLTGRNKHKPRMGANGVGKSTFLDAIFWCLYGHTSRGLKAGDILSWRGKRAQVTVEVTVGKRTFVIRRVQSPNSLTLDGAPADQEAISKALRVNADGFLASIMHSQFGEPFLQLSPAEKLNLFSEIMNLDKWLERSKLAAEKTAVAAERATNALVKSNTLANEIKYLMADADVLAEESLTFETKRQREIAIAAAEYNDRSHQKKQALALLAKANEQSENLENTAAAFDSLAEKKLRKMRLLDTKMGELTVELKHLTTGLEKTLLELAELPKAGGTCTTCHQQMTPDHYKQEKKRLEGAIKKYDVAKKTTKTQLESIARSKQDAFREITATRKDAAAIQQQRMQVTAEISGLRNRIMSHKNRMDHLEETIDTLKNAHNNFEAMIAKKRKRATELNLGLLKAQKELVKAQTEQRSFEPWVAHFKKIRLFIIEKALCQLAIEVNNNLASLGMPDWEVLFDVERENKTGGVTKGFITFVRCPEEGDKFVRFEAWSGGETQRLCLAAGFGLANLIMERAGLNSKVEFYDEPSAHISAEGLQDLAETLAQRAEAEGKVIFLVDHQIIDFGGFAGTFTIVKDSKSASFLK